MRIWGRTYNEDGTWNWVAVTTDAYGRNDNVYLTQLVQVLKLNLGESPFYSTTGIPALRSVVTQVFPDFYVLATQQYFQQGQFASIQVQKLQTTDPEYAIRVVTHQGNVIVTSSQELPT